MTFSSLRNRDKHQSLIQNRRLINFLSDFLLSFRGSSALQRLPKTTVKFFTIQLPHILGVSVLELAICVAALSTYAMELETKQLRRVDLEAFKMELACKNYFIVTIIIITLLRHLAGTGFSIFLQKNCRILDSKRARIIR